MIDINTVVLLTIAITNLITGVLVLIAKRDIRRVEVATNSMKDDLIVSTAKASKAEGHAEGRAEQRVETAAAAVVAAATANAAKGSSDV